MENGPPGFVCDTTVSWRGRYGAQMMIMLMMLKWTRRSDLRRAPVVLTLVDSVLAAGVLVSL
ncbi:hypothetical protein ZHAS_00013646 [Anopheles sinensis]|uniref:Uncharacterized protein n=1 Tax=Anopheles sinensis TaxID=74873 RepID=A0A084W654_ANOSI|nr:hypothetical protein ZHAS_00013646 [Anopheles sinensis]